MSQLNEGQNATQGNFGNGKVLQIEPVDLVANNQAKKPERFFFVRLKTV